MNKKLEIILITVLYLSSLYLWTLPFQENRMPYGDVDSSTHFGLADYMSYKDRSVYYLPYFFNMTYYSKANNGKIWYMPQIHTDAAILQIIGGERILPIFLFWAIICSSIVISMYLLIRKLYGPIYGVITAILLIFSVRDIMWYLWGQYLQVLSFAFVPLVMYSYYVYLESTKKKHKPAYLYLTAILVAGQLFIHPQAIFLSFLTLSFYTIFFILKHRKFPFRIKDIILSALVLFIIVLPYMLIVSGEEMYIGSVNVGKEATNLFKWYPAQVSGVPPSYFSYKEIHKGYWTIPFLLAGVIYLFIRRKNKDLLMLSWLIAFYLSMHQFIIGIGREERLLEAEAHIIYPLVVIGFFFLVSLLVSLIKFKYKNYLKYSLVILFVLFIAYTNGRPAYNQLKGAYPGIYRLTPHQYKAAESMREITPENANIYDLGSLVHAKKKWVRVLSNRFVVGEEIFRMQDLNINLSDYDHIMMDYSGLTLINAQEKINEMVEWEKINLANSTLLYNKDFVRVYKLG